jgi:colicin import membrane protein
MLAFSGAAHLLLAILALFVFPMFGTPPRLEPVAVVDLIGDGEFRREDSTPPPTPAPPAAEKEKPVPEAKTPSTPPPARSRKGAKASADDVARSKQQAAVASLTERMRKMREARSESEAIRGAVEQRRSEAAARAAVRGVRERAAHRIEAPPSVRSGARGAAAGGGGHGTVRLSPELLDYFRRLEESVRSSWVLPGSSVRDAAKLVVELRIVIEKDGRVSEERIERGSGNPYFDESVRRAIRKASPLPVPPEQLRGGEDHYEVGFRFHGGAM